MARGMKGGQLLVRDWITEHPEHRETATQVWRTFYTMKAWSGVPICVGLLGFLIGYSLPSGVFRVNLFGLEGPLVAAGAIAFLCYLLVKTVADWRCARMSARLEASVARNPDFNVVLRVFKETDRETALRLRRFLP